MKNIIRKILKEELDSDWGFVKDFEPPLIDELEYLFKDTEYHIQKTNNPTFFDIKVGTQLIHRVGNNYDMEILLKDLKKSLDTLNINHFGPYWVGIMELIRKLIVILENSILKESEDKDWDWIEDIEVSGLDTLVRILEDTDFEIATSENRIYIFYYDNEVIVLDRFGLVNEWLMTMEDYEENYVGSKMEEPFFELWEILEEYKDKFE